MGSLIELQVNLAREYDGTIVKVIFNKEGKPTKLFYNYEKDENTFNSIQTYKYKNTNDLIEVREYKLKNRYEKVIFVKDTNIILGNYELEGYMKFIFDDKNVMSSVELVGSFLYHDGEQYTFTYGIAMKNYFEIIQDLLRYDKYFNLVCGDMEQLNFTLGRELNKREIFNTLSKTNIRYENKYDNSGNWTERICYLCEKPIEIIKRTIEYY
ncbi:MAG: hypothetical protein IPG12_04690 [Saprospiraceae bacterium]|nr:hypothetical protein [Saprospiraceae bacterium]